MLLTFFIFSPYYLIFPFHLLNLSPFFPLPFSFLVLFISSIVTVLSSHPCPYHDIREFKRWITLESKTECTEVQFEKSAFCFAIERSLFFIVIRVRTKKLITAHSSNKYAEIGPEFSSRPFWDLKVQRPFLCQQKQLISVITAFL